MLDRLFKRKPKLNVGPYEGPVVFSEGRHYPVGEDGHILPGQHLFWEDGGYRWGVPEDPMHRARYETETVELPVQP